MNPQIEICGRMIGYDFDPLIIAEIGINHGGSLDVAKRMVDTAVNAGIEVIKHQTHIVEDEMSQEANKDKIGYIGKTIYELMDECALNESDEFELKKYIESKKAIFISTPFSRAAANRLAEFDVPAFKIGSGECNNYPLIKHICSFGKPIILSTGMNTIESVGRSIKIIEEHNIPYALLHTTNIYPTPPHLVRLGAMIELQDAFPNAVIGLSDHTTTNHACFGAVALGACILERHYTDTMDRERRQDLKPQFLEAGSVYVFLTKGFLSSKNRFFGKKMAYTIPYERVFEIDTIVDLKKANVVEYMRTNECFCSDNNTYMAE